MLLPTPAFECLELHQRTLELTPTRCLPGLDAAIPDTIPKNLVLRTRTKKREMKDTRRCKNAIEQLIRLPVLEESIHFIVDGLYEPCDLIPAVCRMSGGVTVKELTVTTLAMNADNVWTIYNGMEQGAIEKVNLLVSHVFKERDPYEYGYAKHHIESLGGRVNGVRTHTKIILLEMADGNNYVIEGSGNMRSCQSIEQFVMSNDRDLLLFHRNWIAAYMESLGDGMDDTF